MADRLPRSPKYKQAQAYFREMCIRDRGHTVKYADEA